MVNFKIKRIVKIIQLIFSIIMGVIFIIPILIAIKLLDIAERLSTKNYTISSKKRIND